MMVMMMEKALNPMIVDKELMMINLMMKIIKLVLHNVKL